MRRWIGHLHVGQLVMLIAFLAFAGVLPAIIGGVYVGWARSGMDAADRMRDGGVSGTTPEVAEAFMHGAQHQGALGLMWIGAGIAVWLLVLPMLWVWFGARRRNFIVAEIIE